MDRSGQQPVILVGVSGSAASLAALTWAAREARRREARVRVIHAWQPHPARAPYAGTGSSGQYSVPSASAIANRLASDLRAEVGEASDVDLVIEMIEGSAERVLAAASADVDLLVLGSGGQSPVSQVDPLIVDRPIGPVIRACLSHSRCPVVIITPVMVVEHRLDPPGCTVASSVAAWA